jgi:hypothetical protein
MLTLSKPYFTDGRGPGLSEILGALSVVSANFAFGLLPFCAAALVMGSGHFAETMPVFVAGIASAAIALCFQADALVKTRASPLRRLLSSMLLGASFAVMPWMHHKLPLAVPLMILCFTLRWLLFGMETWEIERADRLRQPPPSLSAKIRRSITWITGAVIPLLIGCGAPAVPLLLLSFLLTGLCQWAMHIELRQDASEGPRAG